MAGTGSWGGGGAETLGAGSSLPLTWPSISCWEEAFVSQNCRMEVPLSSCMLSHVIPLGLKQLTGWQQGVVPHPLSVPQ